MIDSLPLAAEQGAAARSTRDQDVLPLLGLAGALTALYALVAVDRFDRFLTAGYDLGIFHQAVLAYSRFQTPLVPLKGDAEGLGHAYNLLGDHFHPLLALLAPVYWVWPDPRALLLTQAVLFGVSIPAVFLSARRYLGRTGAYLLSAAYGLSVGVQGAIGFDFHEIALAVPLLAWGLWAALTGRWSLATVLVLSLLGVKEDLALVVSAFGAYCIVQGQRLRGLLLLVLGAAAFLLITQAVMPAISQQGYAYWSYTALGPDAPSALRYTLRHPWSALQVMLHPVEKVRTLGELLTQTGMLSLVSPLFLVAVPVIAERALSDRRALWSTHSHYSATAAPILFIAAADGLARVLRLVPIESRRRVAALLPAFVLAVIPISTILGDQPFGRYLDRDWRVGTGQEARQAAVVLRALPAGVPVEASNRLVPALLVDHDVWQANGQDSGREWVVLDTRLPEWPMTAPRQLSDRLGRLAEGRYVVVRAAGPWVLFRKPLKDDLEGSDGERVIESHGR